MLLSIIVPFYNAEHKSSRILNTLQGLQAEDVELILIDDGSSDGTKNMLAAFSETALIKPLVIHQKNKGPGGARNSGLRRAQGKYVCFIDCDDDFEPDIIDVLREKEKKNYDFIDFGNISETAADSELNLPAGEYLIDETNRIEIVDKMPIFTNKFVRRDFLLEHHLFYPEYCLFEDNPMTLLSPFYLSSFYKCEKIGFYKYKCEDSVIHSHNNLKFIDRLWTMAWGYKKALQLDYTDEEKKILFRKFTRIFLLNSLGVYLSLKNPRKCYTALKIIARYRKIVEETEISYPLFSIFEFSFKRRIYLKFFWYLSYLVNSDGAYFRSLYQKAWRRDCPAECLEVMG